MQIHPDKTAFRAVDACGGAYTPSETISGWADGHSVAIIDALNAVKAVDSRTAALLECLLTARDYVSDVVEGHLVGKTDLVDMARKDLARIDATIADVTTAP